jgi:hypothetical protein
VIQKAQAGQHTKNLTGRANTETTLPDTPADPATASRALIRVPRTLSPSIENQGLSFFIYNYATAKSAITDYHLDHLLGGRTSSCETLSAAASAIGIAGLANIRRNNDLSVLARQKYTFALRRTNEQLQDPIEARSDQTFGAVNLLGCFEVKYPLFHSFHPPMADRR